MSFTRSKFIANILNHFEHHVPLNYADNTWDNVGLIYENLLEPVAKKPIILLTIDITGDVMREALEMKAAMILSYHPPWFSSAKQLRVEKLPIITAAASYGISLYCMHTALDAMPGGVNDWLIESIFNEAKNAKLISENQHFGRYIDLTSPVSLNAIIKTLKLLFEVDKLRVAISSSKSVNEIKKVAVCAGSGSSVLRDVDADLYITGEMGHHDILYANSRGIHVILGEHTNTERGYLKVLKERLQENFEAAEFVISTKDHDPITIL